MADQPRVVGSWVTDDTSAHHIELAQTDMKTGSGGEPVLALRDTQDPGHIIYATQGQIRLFVQSAQKQDSRTAQLIGAGSARR
jgi:hypothetical protein